MKVYCKTCHAKLTPELQRLPDESHTNEMDGQNYLPTGFYLKSDGTYFTHSKGKIIVNTGDLINANYHPDPRRLNGCCGLHGCDGPNRICVNGHEIATEISDCWMPHAVLFECDTTYHTD